MERTKMAGGYSNFPQQNIFLEGWNKAMPGRFTLEGVPEQHSFEALALPLLDQLYNFAHWLTQDRSEAEDLVQETYAKALKGFDLFQQGTNFRAWVYKILRNTFLTSRTGMRAATDQFDDEKADVILPPVKETPESCWSRKRTASYCKRRWLSCRCRFAKWSCWRMWKKCRTRKSPKRSGFRRAR